jgi:hypothetical protein
MDENSLETGLAKLNDLSSIEYHQQLSEVFADEDSERVVARIGRLVGVLIKEPVADARQLPTPSERTGAYRAWDLKMEPDFNAALASNPQQRELFDKMRLELASEDEWFTTISNFILAQEAHHERGFFGLYARALHKYICGDKEIRKKVDDAFKAYSRIGGRIKAPTPEGIVGAGGITLGAYLIQHVPLLGLAGAPVVAGVVLVLYVLGVNAFCEWSKQVRTDENER